MSHADNPLPNSQGQVTALAPALCSADRLRGLRAAQRAINSMLEEARAALQPGGNRQGRSKTWWRGQFNGLVAADSALALADNPNNPDNAVLIDEILKPNVKDEPRGANNH